MRAATTTVPFGADTVPPAAMNAATTQEAARYAAWGVSCLVIGSDQSLLRAAAHEVADVGGERLRAALDVPSSTKKETLQ